MELRPGFRQTDVGTVPDDWKVGPLQQFWRVIDCKHVTAPFVNDGTPVASITEVQNRFVDLSTANHTTPEYYSLLIEGGRKPLPGDLILSRNATVGEVAQVTEWHPPFAMGQDVCLLRRRTGDSSAEFLQGVLQSDSVRRQLSGLMVGSTFKRVNVSQIKDLLVAMPPSTEQRTIATVLMQVDDVVQAISQLIAKKRDLKQAAMHQLLTGQIRLPGFSGEWTEKRLGEVADIVSGGTPRTVQATYWNGGIRWCTPTDITATTDKYLWETQRTISRAGLSSCSAQLLPAGALLLCSRATIGELKIAAREVCTNQGFKSLVVKNGVSNEFLYYLLLMMKPEMIERAIGSTFLEISKRDTASLPLNLPEFEEQAAIAAVLSDMDAEIAALEQRLAKTRGLKQGMMQELLTGRTRLVTAAAPAASVQAIGRP